MNVKALDLIRDLEDELTSMKDRVAELKQLFWDGKNQLEALQERVWMLEQLADPNYDGHPYSDTLGT